jgi:hypothetical protein
MYFPAAFELPHPLAVPGAIGDIYNYPDEVVSVENPTVTPVAFYLLRLVTSRTEMSHDFENRLGNPLPWDISSIIESEG